MLEIKKKRYLSISKQKWRWYCHGMTESVKVYRKNQSVEDFSSKCLFLLFWTILCVSLISLKEI